MEDGDPRRCGCVSPGSPVAEGAANGAAWELSPAASCREAEGCRPGESRGDRRTEGGGEEGRRVLTSEKRKEADARWEKARGERRPRSGVEGACVRGRAAGRGPLGSG